MTRKIAAVSMAVLMAILSVSCGTSPSTDSQSSSPTPSSGPSGPTPTPFPTVDQSGNLVIEGDFTNNSLVMDEIVSGVDEVNNVLVSYRSWSFFTNSSWGYPSVVSGSIANRTLTISIDTVYWDQHYSPRVQHDALGITNFADGTPMRFSYWIRADEERPVQNVIGRRLSATAGYYADYGMGPVVYIIPTTWTNIQVDFILTNSTTGKLDERGNNKDAIMFEFGGTADDINTNWTIQTSVYISNVVLTTNF